LPKATRPRQAAFAKCRICHQVGPGAKTLVGPELNGVVGRKAASVADYSAMYSPGMKKLGADGWVWTDENIDKWIANPKALIPDRRWRSRFGRSRRG
jgi:cytochrome c